MGAIYRVEVPNHEGSGAEKAGGTVEKTLQDVIWGDTADIFQTPMVTIGRLRIRRIGVLMNGYAHYKVTRTAEGLENQKTLTFPYAFRSWSIKKGCCLATAYTGVLVNSW